MRLLHIPRSWRAALLAALIALALLVAACAPSAPAAAPAPESQQPAAAEAAARAGTLRIAMQAITTTDPAFVQSDSDILVAGHVYDYLVDVDPANNIIPRLATSWTVSDDGLTYVFKLAEGVTFHDGAPLTAEDVVWTFDRLRDPKLELPTASLYSKIANIAATGDLEVTFTLSQPNPFFLYDLSDNHALVVKAGTTDFSKFNGTGPFKVASYLPEDRIELVANAAYFLEGQPKLAGLEVLFFADDTAMADALRGGQVDVMMRIPTPIYQSLKGEANLVLKDIPTNSFDLVRLRSDREPGNRPEVIQAIKLATDRQAIFQQVEQGFGAIGRDSPIGPMYAAYYSEETPLPARDVAKARELLAQAGYPDGLKIDLHTPDTGNRPDLAVVLKEQWKEAGIDVNVIVEPESVYFGDNGWLEVDLGITNWGSRPYPQFYLDVMLKCGAQWNESKFCDPEFDKLAELAGTTLNEEERVQAYKEIQRILIERGPILITSFWPLNTATTARVQGFAPKPFAGRTDFRLVSVSE